MDDEQFQRLTRLALSLVLPANQVAAWVEGVLKGGSEGVMQQDNLWKVLDLWLSDLPGDTFVALLPILRRAFATFEPPARRKIGEKVKYLHNSHQGAYGSQSGGATQLIDTERAEKILPILAQIMGVNYAG